MDAMEEQPINPVDASQDVIKEAIKFMPKIPVNIDDNQIATPAQKNHAKEIDEVVMTTVQDYSSDHSWGICSCGVFFQEDITTRQG